MTSFVQADKQSTPDWARLLDNQQTPEAESLCNKMAAALDLATRVEAQKCLANVALAKGPVLNLQGDDTGGGTLGSSYTPEAADEALKHLDKGLSLAPQDLSIHEGRLHVLEVCGRFSEMMKALDESATIYKGTDALESWLAYDAELANMGQIKAAIQFAEILDRHYPNQHDVIGNIGAFHDMLHEWSAGLPYVQRAVTLAPNDPVDNWNLGWTYDHLEQVS